MLKELDENNSHHEVVKEENVVDEDLVEIMFDNYLWDFGNDGLAGDTWTDLTGDNQFTNAWEGGNTLFNELSSGIYGKLTRFAPSCKL